MRASTRTHMSPETGVSCSRSIRECSSTVTAAPLGNHKRCPTCVGESEVARVGRYSAHTWRLTQVSKKYEAITVGTRTIWKAILPLAALICMSAWGQATPTPSTAGTTRTPGTPGASDTPGTSQASSGDNSAAVSSSPRQVSALKKQAAKDSRKNAAAAANAAKSASSAPPK